MRPEKIIEQATLDGLTLDLTDAGELHYSGTDEAVARWLPVLRGNKPSIVAALQGAANEAFSFSPPGDPANDSEALAERAAIMAEANGWDDATAMQEARWQVDRERCWRAFLRNAKQILEAPAHQREKLLALYQFEATRRYGQAAGADMAGSLRSWIKARGVH
ncbi:MAG: hypothetical protein HY661_07410 [Betaproteobacteria bacterium]|nr:hypothetical protein [Betaproteobacteria bacterium]